MKKMRFALITVAFIGLLSAFATKNTKTTDYRLTRVGNVFTYQTVDYVPVADVTGETQGVSYSCVLTTPIAECTFISTEQAQLHYSILSISKTAWDARTSVTYGLFQQD